MAKLLSYKYLIPCQHGYNHRYFEFSEVLKLAGDPENKSTISTFNEVENNTKEDVLEKVLLGKHILQIAFNKHIHDYIPVCNTIDSNLLYALRLSGLTNLHLVKSTADIDTPLAKKISHFSGRLAELPYQQNICLHVTWEYTWINEFGWDKWLENFYKVFEKKTTTKPKPIIPKVANFYWNNETPISYLRYLTLLTFRHFHPEWEMNLWISDSNRNNVWDGVTEQQEFQRDDNGTNYISYAIELGVKFKKLDLNLSEVLAPNYISDLARFNTIDGGGWFFDLDQIFTRPFDDLCDGSDFVTGVGYVDRINCGVLGASYSSMIPRMIRGIQYDKLKVSTQLKGYCELGNHLLHDSLQEPWAKTIDENLNITKSEVFYPISTSPEVVKIYSGELNIAELENNYAVHWYGGHPISQEFNRNYTEAFAKLSNDAISVYCRKIGIIK